MPNQKGRFIWCKRLIGKLKEKEIFYSDLDLVLTYKFQRWLAWGHHNQNYTPRPKMEQFQKIPEGSQRISWWTALQLNKSADSRIHGSRKKPNPHFTTKRPNYQFCLAMDFHIFQSRTFLIHLFYPRQRFTMPTALEVYLFDLRSYICRPNVIGFALIITIVFILCQDQDTCWNPSS